MLDAQLSKTTTDPAVCRTLKGYSSKAMPPRQPPACEQCRYKQKRCDRQRPCEKCKTAPHLCLYPGDPGYSGNLKILNKLKVRQNQNQDLHSTNVGVQGAVQAANQSEPQPETKVGRGGIGNAKWPEKDVSVLRGRPGYR